MFVDEKVPLDNPVELPTPATTSKATPLKRPLHFAQRLVFFSLISFLAIWHLSADSNSSLDNKEAHRNHFDLESTRAYWEWITSKGFPGSLGFLQPHPHTQTYEHRHKHHSKIPHFPHRLSPKAAEELFLTVPNNQSVHDASERYTANAHPAGSGFDLITALMVKNEWERELGIAVSGPEEHIYDAGSAQSQARIKGGEGELSVWIDTYYPVMNTPVTSSVTLLTDPPIKAKLREEYVEGDPDSIQRDEVRVFHGLSVSGDVTGKYIYAGYGTKAEFDLLESKGVNFTGTIAIVKYGGVFRGLKVKGEVFTHQEPDQLTITAAQEAGAVGCIIYSDPADDGIHTEANGYKQYPKGPARVPSSVQRGSVQFLSMYPGDPTTPGEPAYKNATRIEGGNFPSIPSLPLSYEDAIPILKALKGKGFPASELGPSFEGGLGYYGVEYFSGPSDIDLHFVNEVNTRVMPIWNTMAVIPGHIHDEVIIMGNHRDAWVLGGSDPNSGSASQYELVRGLGVLMKHGWKPLRTIILASWDAEEYGLIGSTEWAEDFGTWIQEKTAAYLNLDSSASGQNFKAAASPSLAWLVRDAADQVISASSGKSYWEARLDGGDWDDFRHEVLGLSIAETEPVPGTGVKPLGSGSDYTAFLMRYGIASSDMSFGNGPKDPVYHYHSIYDSHTWQQKYGDPGFHRHTDATKILGLVLLRLVDSLVLPFNTTQYTVDLEYYLEKIEKIKGEETAFASLNLSSLASSISELQTASREMDETKTRLVEKLHELLLQHDHDTFTGRIKRFFRSALGQGCARHSAVNQMEIFDDDSVITSTTTTSTDSLPKTPNVPLPWGKKADKIKAILKQIRTVNLKLKAFESGFISEKGITDREWYKHKGTSPGKWLGYGATTFPALTEALTIEKSVTLAQTEADELATMLNKMTLALRA